MNSGPAELEGIIFMSVYNFPAICLFSNGEAGISKPLWGQKHRQSDTQNHGCRVALQIKIQNKCF